MTGTHSTSTRRKRVLVAGAALLGAAACTWLVLNLSHAELPERLWTAADLPAAPDDNGWVELTTELPTIDLPEPLQPLQDDQLSPAAFWSTAEAEGEVLQAFLTSEAAVEALDRFDRARRRAVFVDTCTPGGTCLVFPWHKAHGVVELRAVDRVRTGQLGAAVDDLDTLLRMNLEQLASARSMISALVALSNVRSVLVQIDMLAGYDGLDRAAAARLAQRVESIDVDALDLRTLVKAEYIWLTDMLAGGELPDSVDLSASPGLLYDPAETLAELNARFTARHEAAAAGDTLAAFGHGQPRATESFGWWLDNPAGKMLVDITQIDPEISGKIDDSKQEVTELRARVLARLAGSS